MSELAVRRKVFRTRKAKQGSQGRNINNLNMKTLNRFFERMYGNPMRELTVLFVIAATWTAGTYAAVMMVAQ